MRLIGAFSIVFTLALTFAISGFAPPTIPREHGDRSADRDDRKHRPKHRDPALSLACRQQATRGVRPKGDGSGLQGDR